MRPLSQGTARRTDARPARRARAHDRTRRGRTAARTSRLIGAIVAGGGSTRFGGEPKGLHRVGGIRIIDRVVSALSHVTNDWILIANAPDAPTWLPGVRVVADVRPERASIVGIHTALSFAQQEVIVVAWDMPFVSAKLLGAIADYELGFPVLPIGPRGPEPFCAMYTPQVLPVLEDSMAQGDFRLRHFVDRLPFPVTIPSRIVATFGDPERLFFNVNTPDDLAAAERMARED